MPDANLIVAMTGAAGVLAGAFVTHYFAQIREERARSLVEKRDAYVALLHAYNEFKAASNEVGMCDSGLSNLRASRDRIRESLHAAREQLASAADDEATDLQEAIEHYLRVLEEFRDEEDAESKQLVVKVSRLNEKIGAFGIASARIELVCSERGTAASRNLVAACVSEDDYVGEAVYLKTQNRRFGEYVEAARRDLESHRTLTSRVMGRVRSSMEESEEFLRRNSL